MGEKIEALGTRHIQVRVSDDEFTRVKARAGSERGALQKFARSAVITAATDPGAAAPKSASEDRLHDMLSQIVNSGDREVLSWLHQTLRLIARRTESLDPEEARLVGEYRRSSYDKRRRMLAFAAKDEDLGPEAMPPSPRRPRKKM